MSSEKTEKQLSCIWLDNQRLLSVEYLDAQEELRSVFDSFESFNNSDECVDYFTSYPDIRIVLITSNVLGRLIVPLIHSCEQIASIYIFYSKKHIADDWTNDFRKIKGIFNDFRLLCDEFKPQANDKEENSTGISFLSCSDDINRQDPSFMYFQLLKEVLLNDIFAESEAETRKNMIAYCRKACADSESSLKILNEFERTFIPELAILWYTKECFLFKMLNKALWTPEPDVLYRLRYFLRHLHRQISLHARAQRDHTAKMIVYRGQSMSTNEIEKLKKNVDGFLSFNNFLSTSLDRKVAEMFLFGCPTGVLFEMEIDPSIQKYPFVNTKGLSYLGCSEMEQELLFSIGTVFRILKIEKQNHFYRVRLRLSDEVDERLASYALVTREETRSTHSFLSLLKLMNEMGQYGSVDRFAQMLADDVGIAVDRNLLGSVHHMFGIIYLNRGQYKESFEHFDKSLNVYLTFLPADHQRLSPTYSCIASVHSHQSDYDKALTFFQLALDCQTNSREPDLSSIIHYTKSLAQTYRTIGRNAEALDYYKRILELQQCLGENDTSIAETCRSITQVCFAKGDFMEAFSYMMKSGHIRSEDTSVDLDPNASASSLIQAGDSALSEQNYELALNYFKQALDLQHQFLLPNHPSLSKTNSRIADTYYKQNQYQESLQHYLKTLEIEQSSLSTDHPSIASSYHNISKAYLGLGQWSDAEKYAMKSVEQLKKSLDTNQVTLASYIDHIGYVYAEQNKYEQALTYYDQALHLHRLYSAEDDSSLIGIYYRIGNAYFSLKKYTDALIFYQRTLDIESKHSSDDGQAIAQTYSSLAVTYYHLRQYDDALVAAQQAVHQLRKTLPINHPEVVSAQRNVDAIQQRV
ncbi:unnamed protein product [Adineta ricciae]|uniref:NAD(P)(+)--arginine ADP-ribosyltransferase n=1 Tax=Adineta ricciae TaxID=249248 RepID=A0A813RSW4_ADIRI|nr:unnamed protein product [Adineta ricciae]CAF1216886.1 unnamed protein product [Adineta ricciae]